MPVIHSALVDLGGLDTLAQQQTPIHRLDPRAKVLVALGFIVTVVSFDKYEVSGLLPLLAYPVALIILGALPPRYLLGKLLLAAPFALLIGIANPLLDRTILLELGPLRISGGWISFTSIVLRVGMTLLAALILIATTGVPSVCLGLNRLGMPRVFTVQLMLLYRYIFVLGDEASRMTRAWSLRAAGMRKMSPRVFVSLAGQLLLRALDRARRLHVAMLCRGFNGDIHISGPVRFKTDDAIYVAAWAGFFLAARFYHLPHILGQAVMRLAA